MKNPSHYPILEYRDLLRIIFGLKTDQSESSTHQLAMIGGVHGSGKSYICERLAQDIPFVTCVSASGLVEHAGIYKHVTSVSDNQNLLIERLKRIKDRNELTVVDGHFCVADKSGAIHYVGEEIFKCLSPSILILVMASSEAIIQRIITRDHIKYSLPVIERMKQEEFYWASYTSEVLSIPLCQVIG